MVQPRRTRSRRSSWAFILQIFHTYVKINTYVERVYGTSLVHYMRDGVAKTQPYGDPRDTYMRTEIQSIVDEIRQAIGLLRRHL